MVEANIQFDEIYQALTELSEQKKLDTPRNPIGYVKPKKEQLNI